MPTSLSIRQPKDLFKKYTHEIDDPIALVATAGKGLDIRFFDQLIKLTGLNKRELADIIDATPKTIDNRRSNRRPLGRIESEQLLQILALYKKGEEVFGSTGSFHVWLKEPVAGLGGSPAITLMRSPGGIQLIMEELIRIEFGALA